MSFRQLIQVGTRYVLYFERLLLSGLYYARILRYFKFKHQRRLLL